MGAMCTQIFSYLLFLLPIGIQTFYAKVARDLSSGFRRSSHSQFSLYYALNETHRAAIIRVSVTRCQAAAATDRSGHHRRRERLLVAPEQRTPLRRRRNTLDGILPGQHTVPGNGSPTPRTVRGGQAYENPNRHTPNRPWPTQRFHHSP